MAMSMVIFCPYCKKGFIGIQAYLQHIQAFHPEYLPEQVEKAEAVWTSKGLTLPPLPDIVRTVTEIPNLPKATPEEEANMSQFFIFSPFVVPVEDPFLEMMVVLLAGVKLAKTPEGLKVLRDLGVEYLRTISHVLGELEASSASNWLVAMINQRIAVKVYRRVGLISATEAHQLDSIYSWMFSTAMLKEGITDSLSGLGQLARGVGALIGAGK